MIVTATNGTGLELRCVLEQSVAANGITYGLLSPDDVPVCIADDEGIETESEDLIEIAEHILSGCCGLELIRSAGCLTVRGELNDPDPDPVPDLDDLPEEGDTHEVLLSFTGPDGRRYNLLTPFEPWFCIAQQDGEQWRILDHEHALQIAPIFGTDLEPLA